MFLLHTFFEVYLHVYKPPISWQSLIYSPIKLCTFDILYKKGRVVRSYCYCSVRLSQEKEKGKQGQ